MLALLTAAGMPQTVLAQGSGPDIPWLRIILALGFCLALAAAAIWVIRARYGMSPLPGRLQRWSNLVQPAEPASGDRLQIVQRVPVTPGSQLVLVRLGARGYLLHLTATGATEIDRFTDVTDAEA